MSARQPFRSIAGAVAPLRRNHVDTDQIIPKQFLKRIERIGLRAVPVSRLDERDPGVRAESAAIRRRVDPGRRRRTSAAARRANTRRGRCIDAGFRVVIAPSFADIFRNNAIGNGMLPVALAGGRGRGDPRLAPKQDDGYELEIDLERCEVRDRFGLQRAVHDRRGLAPATARRQGRDRPDSATTSPRSPPTSGAWQH